MKRVGPLQAGCRGPSLSPDLRHGLWQVLALAGSAPWDPIAPVPGTGCADRLCRQAVRTGLGCVKFRRAGAAASPLLPCQARKWR